MKILNLNTSESDICNISGGGKLTIPKLPNELTNGEIAICSNKGHEAIIIKNTNDEMVEFSPLKVRRIQEKLTYDTTTSNSAFNTLGNLCKNNNNASGTTIYKYVAEGNNSIDTQGTLITFPSTDINGKITIAGKVNGINISTGLTLSYINDNNKTSWTPLVYKLDTEVSNDALSIRVWDTLNGFAQVFPSKTISDIAKWSTSKEQFADKASTTNSFATTNGNVTTLTTKVNSIQSTIDALPQQLANKASTDNLTKEVNRAKAEEGKLTTAIGDEVTRAKAEEARIEGKVDNNFYTKAQVDSQTVSASTVDRILSYDDGGSYYAPTFLGNLCMDNAHTDKKPVFYNYTAEKDSGQSKGMLIALYNKRYDGSTVPRGKILGLNFSTGLTFPYTDSGDNVLWGSFIDDVESEINQDKSMSLKFYDTSTGMNERHSKTIGNIARWSEVKNELANYLTSTAASQTYASRTSVDSKLGLNTPYLALTEAPGGLMTSGTTTSNPAMATEGFTIGNTLSGGTVELQFGYFSIIWYSYLINYGLQTDSMEIMPNFPYEYLVVSPSTLASILAQNPRDVHTLIIEQIQPYRQIDGKNTYRFNGDEGYLLTTHKLSASEMKLYKPKETTVGNVLKAVSSLSNVWSKL